MTSFDLKTFLRQPRLSGLALSPDGRRLVVGVSTPAPDGKKFRTALWSVDPDGEATPRQLTRSAPGESGATFAPDGSLLFVSARPDPDAKPESDAIAGLWSLPSDGGEARLVFAPPAGVAGLSVADDSGEVVVSSHVHPAADDLAADRERQKSRDDAGVTAQLYESYPIRFWDAYLGPREPARWVLGTDVLAGPGPEALLQERPDPDATSSGSDQAPEHASSAAGTEAAVDEPPLLLRGAPLRNADGDLSPDGRTYVTAWRRADDSMDVSGPDDLITDLIAVDVQTGERRTLIAGDRSHGGPVISPDGTQVICTAVDVGSPDQATDHTLVLVDLASGSARYIAPELDLWPSNPRWLPSGDAIIVEADEAGHHPLFHIDLVDGEVTRLTAAGAFTDVCIAPDGEHLFAMYATIGSPHQPVRLGTSGADQEPTILPSPVGETPSNARVERIVTTADDGVEVGSWLVLPHDTDGPVPLVVFIHGGPLGSWNTWHWRWSPFVLAEQGYAVLLPDPALSTGYGQEFIQRGWGRWGAEPYTDLLSAIDAAAEHSAIDETRIAATGGSFGGYMANWIAGHTDRFRCIITHASLWALEGFHGTTDLGVMWEREFGDPYKDASRFTEHSPHRFIDQITTPMLVIHGEKDLRVPISEGLTLWTDLARHGVAAKFLYFPDENHWILKPQNVSLWYQTVLNFLGEHLQDRPFERPELL